MRRSWLAAGIVAATLLALAAQGEVVARTGFFVGDFRAFYCAARAVSSRADPYRTQPLGRCERATGFRAFFRRNPGVVIPAPLPGYALAALVPLSRLPFAAAAALWLVLLALGCAAAVFSLARFVPLPWEEALAIFALPLATLSLPFGEVVPLSVGAIGLAGLAARSGRWRLAGIAAAAAMIEPHVGLPACVALAIWAPRSRAALALAAAALGALSLLTLGVAANVEYFSAVLPAHALAELTRDTQYSLSAILAAAGAAPSAAVRGGMLWYAALSLAGVAAGGILARKTGNAAWIACAPPACAVFGGSFVHVTQLAVALPAAALLAAQGRGMLRDAAIAVLLLLAVPWGWVVSPALLLAPLVPVGYLAWRYWHERRTALLAALAAAFLLLALQQLYRMPMVHLGAQPLVAGIARTLPEASWNLYAHRGSHGSLAAWAVRLPTWIALGALVAMLLAQAAGRRMGALRPTVTALALLFTIGPIAAQFAGDRAAGWAGIDVRAYYCAALAQREGRDPYLAASLLPCERANAPPAYRVPAAVAVPAPFSIS